MDNFPPGNVRKGRFLMTNTFRLYSKELLPVYLFVCILFIMGVVFGALLVNALTLQQKQDVGLFINSFISNYGGAGDMQASAAQAAEAPAQEASASQVWEVFGSHARWVFFIWILGLSVVGVPIILLLDFLKGVLVGFTVGYLAGQWSWQGVLFALASVVPQNLIAVPVIMIASAAAIAFSIYLVRSRLLNRAGPLGQAFTSFSLSAVLLTVLLLFVSIFEVYVSPDLLEWAAPMLVAPV